MGNWHVSVRGHGQHHNNKDPKDANELAAKFVQDLKAAGQTIEGADFHSSGRDDLDKEKV